MEHSLELFFYKSPAYLFGGPVPILRSPPYRLPWSHNSPSEFRTHTSWHLSSLKCAYHILTCIQYKLDKIYILSVLINWKFLRQRLNCVLLWIPLPPPCNTNEYSVYSRRSKKKVVKETMRCKRKNTGIWFKKMYLNTRLNIISPWATLPIWALLQEIFPTQGSNPGLSHCRQILYHLSHPGSPRILEWVAYPFSSRSSQPRSQTGVSCLAGRFLTSWATREANMSHSFLNLWKKGE